MHRFRFFTLLVSPSFFSAVMVSIFTGLILAAGNWGQLRSIPAIYEMFFGEQGLVTGIQQTSQGAFGELLARAFENTASYYVVIILVAVGVAVIIYGILQGVTDTANDVHEVAGELRSVEAAQAAVRRSVMVTAFLRAASIIGWIVYMIVFLQIILPFAVLAFGTGIHDQGQSQVTYTIGAIALLWLGLHLQVIFMRILLRRLRVFGRQDYLLLKLYSTHDV